MNQLEHPQEESIHAPLVHPDLRVHQEEVLVEVEAEVGAEIDRDQEIEPWEEEEKGVEVTAEVEAVVQRLSKQNLQEFLEYLD